MMQPEGSLIQRPQPSDGRRLRVHFAIRSSHERDDKWP